MNTNRNKLFFTDYVGVTNEISYNQNDHMSRGTVFVSSYCRRKLSWLPKIIMLSVYARATNIHTQIEI